MSTVLNARRMAEDKSKPRGEERIFLCYFERHGIMDGSILTISPKAALTGGQLYMHRSRDFRAPEALSFPLRQARDWQSWLASAKIWTQASSQQLRDEIDNMIQHGKDYKPQIVFEIPRSIQEAASKTAVWEPAVSEMIEEAPAAILSEQIEYEPADKEGSEPIPEGEAHGHGSLAPSELEKGRYCCEIFRQSLRMLLDTVEALTLPAKPKHLRLHPSGLEMFCQSSGI